MWEICYEVRYSPIHRRRKVQNIGGQGLEYWGGGGGGGKGAQSPAGT